VNSDHARALAAPACGSGRRRVDRTTVKSRSHRCQISISSNLNTPRWTVSLSGAVYNGTQPHDVDVSGRVYNSTDERRTSTTRVITYQLRVVFIGCRACTGLEPRHEPQGLSAQPRACTYYAHAPAAPEARCRQCAELWAHIRHLVRVWSVSVSDVGFSFCFPSFRTVKTPVRPVAVRMNR